MMDLSCFEVEAWASVARKRLSPPPATAVPARGSGIFSLFSCTAEPIFKHLWLLRENQIRKKFCKIQVYVEVASISLPEDQTGNLAAAGKG